MLPEIFRRNFRFLHTKPEGYLMTRQSLRIVLCPAYQWSRRTSVKETWWLDRLETGSWRLSQWVGATSSEPWSSDSSCTQSTLTPEQRSQRWQERCWARAAALRRDRASWWGNSKKSVYYFPFFSVSWWMSFLHKPGSVSWRARRTHSATCEREWESNLIVACRSVATAILCSLRGTTASHFGSFEVNLDSLGSFEVSQSSTIQFNVSIQKRWYSAWDQSY